MKKKIALIVIIVAIVVKLVVVIQNNTTDSKFKLNMETENNSEIVKVGEEVVLAIKVNETIIASNFEINYDSEVFELVGSETDNFNVAYKNGKLACIYADINGIGTNEFKIKFVVTKEKADKASFKIENAKFRAIEKEESYTGTQILGIDKELKLKVQK